MKMRAGGGGGGGGGGGEGGGGGVFYKSVWQLKGLPEAQEPPEDKFRHGCENLFLTPASILQNDNKI